MPIDFTKPVTTDAYASLLSGLLDAHVALARWLDPATAGTLTGTPTGAYRINGGVFQQYNGSVWNNVSMGYPTLTGGGASGTWAINITGSSASCSGNAASASTVPWAGVTGAPAITGMTADTSASASTVARRDSNGYLYAVYFNQSSSNNENPAISQVLVTNGADGFVRKASLAHLGASITVPWTSISGRPTNISSFTNDSGYITSAALSPYATTASLSAYATTASLGAYAPLASPNFTGNPNLPSSGAMRVGGHITRFESAELTVPSTNLSVVTATHGGSRAPDSFKAVLRCKIAEGNWAVGDEVNFPENDIGVTDRNAQFFANATQVGVAWVSGSNNPPALRNKTASGVFTLTSANWRLVFRCIWL